MVIAGADQLLKQADSSSSSSFQNILQQCIIMKIFILKYWNIYCTSEKS